MRLRQVTLSLLAAAVPLALLAFPTGAPIKMTGAPGDQDCSVCHRGTPVNSAGGRVSIQAGNYRPSQKQIIKVTVEDAAATRWGFELTARVGESVIAAGNFTPTHSVQVRCDDGTRLGSAAPCAEKALQFATHTLESTSPGKTGSQTWDVEWTPPIEEMGDIVFYAAGNAANNSTGTGVPGNAGDRIYTSSVRVQSDAPCGLTQKPTLVTVVGATVPQAGISPNSLITLKGLNFALQGTNRAAGPGDIRDNSFAKELRCVTVKVAGKPAPVIYVSNDQINAQLPADLAPGPISVPVSVQVIINSGKANEIPSNVATVNVQQYSPSFFTFDGKSIAAQNPDFSIAADPAVVAGGRPVRPGEIAILYATGLGPSNTPYQEGQIVPLALVPLRDPVAIRVNGTVLAAADVLYAGIAPGSISGLYQLNVRVPANTPNGDIPVSVTVGGVTSPAGTTIPVRAPPPTP